MIEINPRGKMVEKALLVSAYELKSCKETAQSLLCELEELVETLGVPISDRMLVPMREVHARFHPRGGAVG